MNWIKKLLGKKGEPGKATRNGSFMEKLEHDFIPHVMRMIDKQEDHLDFLIKNNAPEEMIQTNQKSLDQFKKRLDEYTDYLGHLKALRKTMIVG
jgi:Zn-dependent oligopeptidase